MPNRKCPKGMIAVPMSATAARGKALELAQVCHDIIAQKEAWAEETKAHKELMDGLEAHRATLADDVKTGTELRDPQEELSLGSRGRVESAAEAVVDAVQKFKDRVPRGTKVTLRSGDGAEHTLVDKP